MPDACEVKRLIIETVDSMTLNWRGATKWRSPVVGFGLAGDPRFEKLSRREGQPHLRPEELLREARTVASYFLPFEEDIVRSNSNGQSVSREWAVAYVETNAMINRIGEELVQRLIPMGVRSVAQPAVGTFDSGLLAGTWSQKSVAVIAGVGSIGVHNMVITDAGCAGRLGSLVLDAPLVELPKAYRERCSHKSGGNCLECVSSCPVGALEPDGSIDRKMCWSRCRDVAREFTSVGLAHVCGKCAVGPCALSSRV